MLTYKRLIKHRQAFKSLTGLSVSEFDELYTRFEPAWEQAEITRLSRPGRKRAIGGGGHYAHSQRSQLLMVMMWLRLYLSTAALGALFDVNKSTISRNSRRLLKVLNEISAPTLTWPEPPQQGLSLDEAMKRYPDLLAVVDVTEQIILRPQDPQQEHEHFSGKRRLPTAKNGLLVNEVGEIRAVTRSYPGRTHDLTLVRQSHVLAHLPYEVALIGDSAFNGLHNDYPLHRVATAHKAERNHPLTLDHKLANHELSTQRIIVENVIAHLKQFSILAGRFRHALDPVHSDAFCVVAALVNRRTRLRLNRLTT
jgi:hypothetical protein